MTISAYKDFDINAFWEDVGSYLRRWNLHTSDLADAVELDSTHMRENFLYRRGLSLAVACRIAAVCDLSLDKYNKAVQRVRI